MKLNFRGSLLLLSLITGLAAGCGKKDDDKKSKVSAQMRSTGIKSLALNLNSPKTMANIESYKVPVSRINLVSGLSGSGYGQASPNFYACPFATDAECAVDLTNASALQNLLKGGGESEVTFSDTRTYEGVAIEFCHEHASMNADGYFTIWVKGSVEIGATTYYTNAQNGLSTTGPSEEVAIKSSYGGCGATTSLLQPITVAPGDNVGIILYGDPTGVVYGSADAATNNSSCLTGAGVALCSEFVSVFGTVDTADPKVERYEMSFDKYGKGLMTFLFNSSDAVFGAAVRPIYGASGPAGDAAPTYYFVGIETSADGSMTLKQFKNQNEQEDAIAGFKRQAHTGTMKFPDGSYSYSATPL